jgi:uncharacterized protein DUF6941
VQVKLAVLADSANVSREGKLNILGIFDTIYARQLPTTHAHMQLVLRFEATAEEAGGTCGVEVRLVSPAGQVVFSFPGTMNLPNRGPGEPVGIDHILSFTNVSLATPGVYHFRLLVEGSPAGDVPLRVEQIAARH